MATIPSYDPASTPLSDTDQFYLEHGTSASRGKRATVKMLMDKAEAVYQAAFQEKALDLSVAGITLVDYLAGPLSPSLGPELELANSFVRIRPIGASIGGSYTQRTFEILGRLHFKAASRQASGFQIVFPKSLLGTVPWRAAFEAAILLPVSTRLGGQIGGAWFPNASSPLWTWGNVWTPTSVDAGFTVLLGTTYSAGLGASAAGGCNFQLQVEA